MRNSLNTFTGTWGQQSRFGLSIFTNQLNFMNICKMNCPCRRFVEEMRYCQRDFPNGFPKIQSLYVKKLSNGGPLYWSQAQSPREGELRDEYRHRLVFDPRLRWGIKEATEISNDFCSYHNNCGEASGQDYVVLGWQND